MTGPRRWFDRAPVMGLAVSLIVLMAGRAGGLSPLLDLASLAAVPAGCILLVCATVLAIRARSTGRRVLLAACLVPGALVLMPGSAPTGTCDETSERLRVAWLNAGRTNDVGPIMAWLAREQPQVFGVAELDKSSLALRQALAERFAYRHSCLANDRCSTMLYAAAAPVDAQGLARGDPENRRTLSAVSMRFGADGSSSPFTIYAAHLSRPLPLGRQAAELRQLEAHFRSSSDLIVMGDFNMSPRMRALRGFAARNGLHATPTDRPTWPLQHSVPSLPPLWQIDQLLLGRDWHAAAIRTSPDLGSDHRGFVADLCRDAG